MAERKARIECLLRLLLTLLCLVLLFSNRRRLLACLSRLGTLLVLTPVSFKIPGAASGVTTSEA